jgi:UDP-N-acetyl-D-glucosamine dehydrogenase
MAIPTTCVVGLGYVGLPLAVALEAKGARVVGLDASTARVRQLASGRSGIEDISDDQVATAVARGLSVTTDVNDAAEAAVYVICVPTPLRQHLPDLGAVEAAARSLAGVLKAGDLVILESTTYPGTTDEFLAPILEESGLKAGVDFHLAYSPERIDPGNATYGLTNTPKIVGGLTPESTRAAAEFYGAFVDQVVTVSGPREAELAKLLENTFRHVNIALVNEMAVFSHELGIDLWQAIDAAATKPFGYMPFYPGPGVGGHCIPVDPSYLSWRLRTLGYQFRFVDLAQDLNNRMPSYVVERLQLLLNDRGVALSRARVLCIGAAYKKNVSDMRESPALLVMERLQRLGARISYHDPFVPSVELEGVHHESVTLDADQISAADAVLILTPHDGLDLESMVQSARLVFDTRAVVPPVEGHVYRL